MTLASSTVLFCPVAEFLKRVDMGVVAKLAADPPAVVVAFGALAADVNVLAALRDASGDIEAAAFMGNRYHKEDFELLLTGPETNARGKLYRICSDLAWVYLFERRPNKDVEAPPSLQRSMAWMDLLVSGKRIFAFVETADAGVTERVEASVEDVIERNGSVYQARALFGTTSDRAQRRQ